MSGFRTLFYKELLRFWKVGTQTVFAPVVTTLLYLLVFAHVLEDGARIHGEWSYRAFLVPGLVMMAILQNSFANSSSSLIQSKVNGNIVFVLLPPISYLEFFGAYVFASLVRGFLVGAGVLVAAAMLTSVELRHPAWILGFAFMGAMILGALGMIAGIWSDRIDQLAGFQNFVIVPATFLSGVFYSIHSLPAFWQDVSRWNPFFYMIDGFRYGFFGTSDVSPVVSAAVVGSTFVALTILTLTMLRTGYKLRH